MKRRLSLICALVLVCATTKAEEGTFPWLDSLDAGDGVKESGRQLIDLPFGLHLLEKPHSNETEFVVGVHGMRSAGYEWVYPLQTMDSESRLTYFYNWDAGSLRCLVPVATDLLEAIGGRIDENPTIESVILVGHSLGGLVVSQLADEWTSDARLDIHTIASPLAGLNAETSDECRQVLPRNESAKVRFFQWRTRFELDNAFNRLDSNPMEVEIPHSVVVTLPETYRNRRLGHNWSVSYVAEQIAEK